MKYENVTVVDNGSKVFNEAERLQLLIETARQKFPGENVLLALDADEIATAESLNPQYWYSLREAPVGTVFYFEKPDLLPGLKTCVRHRDSFYPMAFAKVLGRICLTPPRCNFT